MPKSENQKLKLLYLQKMLLEETDEEHTLTVNAIIERLELVGIKAERKSIYDDIKDLQKFGMDIICLRCRANEYFVGNRDFSLSELKLLADVVETSKFITRKKIIKLTKKLGTLSCCHKAKTLQRRVLMRNRIENMHDSVYEVIDKLHRAIAAKKKVSFNYWGWNLDEHEKIRENVAKCIVNPCVLSWDNGNYFLAVYNNEAEDFMYYRVDKMAEVTILKTACNFTNMKKDIDVSVHTKKYFGMHIGKVRKVELYFDHSLLGVVIDRFGQAVVIKKNDGIGFIISVDIIVNSAFFAWLVELGTNAKILEPETILKEFKEYLCNIIKAK